MVERPAENGEVIGSIPMVSTRKHAQQTRTIIMNAPAMAPEIDKFLIKSHTAKQTVHLMDVIRRFNLEDNETIILNGDGYTGFKKGGYAAIISDEWPALYKACEAYGLEIYQLYFADNTHLVTPKYETDYLTTLALSQDIAEEDIEELTKLFTF